MTSNENIAENGMEDAISALEAKNDDLTTALGLTSVTLGAVSIYFGLKGIEAGFDVDIPSAAKAAITVVGALATPTLVHAVFIDRRSQQDS